MTTPEPPAQSLTPHTRRWLEIQGFDCSVERSVAPVQHWIRFAPALCALVAAAGTVLASPALLWSLAVVAALGAVLPFHPFDLVYRLGVRRLTGGPPLPDNGAPRRFACALGAAMLTVTGALFATGADAAGYVLGALLVATAALVASAHVCIPSLIYRGLTAARRALPV